ncbi:MAG: hypothetical protein EZS28_027213 [Streblomastix strix]|uniref:Uncharacterized protein n=1 Tax=Streblomastix strix TaxID=222440 RepID=A0A5J4V3C9_9EUKA|nr:MAG: hypothetical protein EZS28_027213 [Streblomastix strix]
MNSQNSRRFGFISVDAEIFNNIPISSKDFRAVTFDEKDGSIRLGWHEVSRWILPKLDQIQQWFTYEIDLREEIEHNTIRLFIGAEEAPVIFIDVPKQVKIYIASDGQPNTKYNLQLFKIPNPSLERLGGYSKIVDYNSNLLWKQEDPLNEQENQFSKVEQEKDIIKVEQEKQISNLLPYQHYNNKINKVGHIFAYNWTWRLKKEQRSSLLGYK